MMKNFTRRILFAATLGLLCLNHSAKAQNYTITTTGNAIVITDISGNGDALSISQNVSSINFVVSPATRTYSINGGAITAFTTPANAALAAATSITVNAGAGDDIINIAGFTTSLPNLTINGGTGDDEVNFNGSITFAANSSLDVNMQNDDATPGTDNVAFGLGTALIFSGSGTATIKVSKDVYMPGGNTLRTVNGNLTIEANQQVIPSPGGFRGVFVSTNSTIEATGTGLVTIKGKGGDTGNFNHGVYVYNNSKISGGTAGNLVVEGTGGLSALHNNMGVMVEVTNSIITSYGGNVNVTGQGGGSSGSVGNFGIYVTSSGTIKAGSTGIVSVEGTGGFGTGGGDYGIAMGASGLITSSGGNVSVNGLGGNLGYSIGVSIQGLSIITAGGNGNVIVTGTGGTYSFGQNHGVQIAFTGGTIKADGNGTVTVQGTGGASTGNFNYGIRIDGASSLITSSGGNVSVTGVGGGIGSGVANYGIIVSASGKLNAGGNGTLTVLGTGGTSPGAGHDGVNVSGGTITSAGGNVSVTGVKGINSTNAADIYFMNGGAITSTGTGGNITLTSTTGGTWPNTSTTDVSTTSNKSLSFGNNSKLNIEIDGITVNTQYQQLSVTGLINLSNATLTFTGSTYLPVGGETFTIVNNDGSDVITGTFAGLPEGAVIGNFLGSSQSAQISYTGGTGNDVVLTVCSLNPSISGSTTFCSASSTTLNAGSGYSSYNWSTGATTQTISVNTAATFTVTVTNGSGCTGTDNIVTTVNPSPVALITGSTSFCAGNSTTLNAGSGFSSYNWSAGATTQTISVNTAGTYTVTVTNGNGCTGTATKTTTVNANPTPAITGSTSFCAGSSTVLNAGSFNAYAWSTGATTQTISVSTAGTFTVTVTNASGCTGSDSHTTTVNANPAPVITGSTSFCAGSSTVLNAGSFNSYTWSTGVTTQTISVSTAGTFTVTVTNSSGCTGSDSHTITVNANPAPAITGSTSFCAGSSTVLNAGS
ncbi:MAG: hypothetical protein ABI723_00325, partial [Bacteroidia bacterium]